MTCFGLPLVHTTRDASDSWRAAGLRSLLGLFLSRRKRMLMTANWLATVDAHSPGTLTFKLTLRIVKGRQQQN